MSTIIYNAYLWTGMGGLEGLLRKLTVMRARVFDRAIVEAAKYATAENFDLVKYMDDVRASMKTGNYFTEGGMPSPSCSATLHFDRGSVYVIFFNVPMRRGFAPFGGLHDFHYQNQTDREDGITDKQWNDRRRTWDRIFKKDKHPGHAGLVFEVIDESDGVALAYALFEKLHGHSAGDKKKSDKCEACIQRRKKYSAEQAKKKREGDAMDEAACAESQERKYGKGRDAA